MPLLIEEIFKLSGVPTYTFVKPDEYSSLLVALRTPGRCIVIEGPSGIGKTSSVIKALDELGMSNILKLSARKKEDQDLIRLIPSTSDAGTIIIDDFHRLDVSTREELADYMKVLADEERKDVKIVVIGINRAGDALIQFAPDLNTRIETIVFESNPAEKVLQLIENGEQVLNISFPTKEEIVKASAGSFYLAQYLCYESCIKAGVLEASPVMQSVDVSFESVLQKVMDSLSRRFMNSAIAFAGGTKIRREGRAPYLHILKWLSEGTEWSVQLDRLLAQHPELKGSVGQVMEKGYLKKLIADKEGLSDIFHYDSNTRILGIEDPQFFFFLRNILWSKFAEKVGFINTDFDDIRYDFALSFAGEDRTHAKKLFEILTENEFEIFYDKNEQHLIFAENVEDYLAPIYSSQATYVICFLGPDYPKKVWTKFESTQFKERFGSNSVIPIWYSTSPPGIFDESARVGGFVLNPSDDVDSQIQDFADLLVKKMAERAVSESK